MEPISKDSKKLAKIVKTRIHWNEWSYGIS